LGRFFGRGKSDSERQDRKCRNRSHDPTGFVPDERNRDYYRRRIASRADTPEPQFGRKAVEFVQTQDYGKSSEPGEEIRGIIPHRLKKDWDADDRSEYSLHGYVARFSFLV
jgi:hypothetical protein